MFLFDTFDAVQCVDTISTTSFSLEPLAITSLQIDSRSSPSFDPSRNKLALLDLRSFWLVSKEEVIAALEVA